MRAQTAAEHLRMLPPDEPVFVLRAQDKLAADIVEEWAERLEELGGRSGKVAGAREVVRDMRMWPTQKLPD